MQIQLIWGGVYTLGVVSASGVPTTCCPCFGSITRGPQEIHSHKTFLVNISKLNYRLGLGGVGSSSACTRAISSAPFLLVFLFLSLSLPLPPEFPSEPLRRTFFLYPPQTFISRPSRLPRRTRDLLVPFIHSFIHSLLALGMYR